MQLTKFSDFGLRVLMYLTRTNRSLPVTIAELAQQFEVPHNHLVKVVNRLGKLGWVVAVRGRNGGLSLGIAAERLQLGDVLRALEGHPDLVDCDRPTCVLSGQCLLKSALNAGTAAFYQKMNEYTLADVSAGKTGERIVTLHRNYLNGLASLRTHV